MSGYFVGCIATVKAAMSDGREERAEQEARREWERSELERREKAREYVPALDREGDWEPERQDS